jgi:hypothetical protein
MANVKSQLIADLATLGIVLPTSIRLGGPGLVVLAAAVASAAAVKRMQDQEREPVDKKLNELAGVQMSTLQQRLDALEQHHVRTMTDERADQVIEMMNRSARRQVTAHDRSRDVPSSLHHNEQPAKGPNAQFSEHGFEEELCLPPAEITVTLPQPADVSDERADEIVERALRIRRR